MGHRRPASQPRARQGPAVTVRIVPRRPLAVYWQAQWCWLARIAPAGKLPRPHTLRSVAAKFHTSKDMVTKQLHRLRTIDAAQPLPTWLAARDHFTQPPEDSPCLI